MKFIKKKICAVLCTFLLLLVAGLISTLAVKTENTSVEMLRFLIRDPYKSAEKELFAFDAKDGNYYVFLPSYAELEQVNLFLNTSDSCSLDEITLYDGMNCGVFSVEKPYAFVINDKQTTTLWFYRSANVGTLYIETDTGTMKYIHADKDRKENAAITLYTADGKVDHADDNSILKGRGNYTWTCEKRPYSLTLSSEADLLGMGAADNWVLLANAYDETNLNNKLMLDLASRVGLWGTPDSRWVDVYLNGAYNGLYLLTEKVEAHRNRLNIDTGSGDFLCKVDLNVRWKTLRNPFVSELGRTIEICSPDNLTETEAAAVVSAVNEMERTILSGADLSGKTILDLDSWVRRYLIDEISGNIDSDLASSYFYCLNGTFFAGPAWDYDKVLGNDFRNQNPHTFIARNAKKSNVYLSPYYGALTHNPSFCDRTQALYATQIRPLLQQMMDEGIDRLALELRKAARMNSLRWRSMFDTLHNPAFGLVCSVPALKEYLSRRIAFLDSVWLDNVNYCTVQFELSPGAEYLNYTVKQGSCLETDDRDLVGMTWIDAVTGEPFDLRQPVMADKLLLNQSELITSPGTSAYVRCLCIAVLLFQLLTFVMIDVKRSPRKGQ